MTHAELAGLCQQSYSDNGIDGAVEIGAMGPVAFVIASPQRGCPAFAHVVVFRGTADTVGWAEDLRAEWDEGPLGHSVHAGFLDCWRAVRTRVCRCVGAEPVILTGHSLGGALATLAAAELNAQELVTFGCPRVGDAAFAASIASKTRASRYVNRFDPVPWVPGYVMGYRHPVKPTWYDGAGWHLGLSAISAVKIAAQHLRMVGSLLSGLRREHDIAAYIKAMK